MAREGVVRTVVVGDRHLVHIERVDREQLRVLRPRRRLPRELNVAAVRNPGARPAAVCRVKLEVTPWQ